MTRAPSTPKKYDKDEPGLAPTSADTEEAAERPEFPLNRSILIYVTGGLDGVARIVMTLRSRRYRVHNLIVNVREGVVESRIGCTIPLTANEMSLLLERLRRLPAVVSAENA